MIVSKQKKYDQRPRTGREVVYRISYSLRRSNIRLWDVQNGHEIGSFATKEGAVSHVVLSPDGRYVLTDGWDNRLYLWDVESGREIRRFFEGHKYAITCVSFAPDGRRAISGAVNSTLRLWDVESGREIRRCKVNGFTTRAADAPDGRHALYGGSDGAIGLVSVERGRLVRHFGGFFGTTHKVAPACLTYAPDDNRALSGGGGSVGRAKDCTVRLWDVNSGRELRRFEGHAEEVLAVAFSPDGQTGLSAGADGAVRLWELPLS